jgi:hypothetical protein
MKIIKALLILSILMSFQSSWAQDYGDDDYDQDQQFQESDERRPPPRRRFANVDEQGAL